MGHIWQCSGLFLALHYRITPGRAQECCGSNLGQLYARLMPSPLHFCSFPSSNFLKNKSLLLTLTKITTLRKQLQTSEHCRDLLLHLFFCHRLFYILKFLCPHSGHSAPVQPLTLVGFLLEAPVKLVSPQPQLNCCTRT